MQDGLINSQTPVYLVLVVYDTDAKMATSQHLVKIIYPDRMYWKNAVTQNSSEETV